MGTRTVNQPKTIYPKGINVGDRVLVRKAATGGYYEDAGTVKRGRYGRAWATVTDITVKGRWFYATATLEDGTELTLGGATNSKRIVQAN